MHLFILCLPISCRFGVVAGSTDFLRGIYVNRRTCKLLINVCQGPLNMIQRQKKLTATIFFDSSFIFAKYFFQIFSFHSVPTPFQGRAFDRVKSHQLSIVSHDHKKLSTKGKMRTIWNSLLCKHKGSTFSSFSARACRFLPKKSKIISQYFPCFFPL